MSFDSETEVFEEESHGDFGENSEDETVKVFVIGDIHYKASTLFEGEIFTEKVINAVSVSQPDFIVILGDTLDTHEVVRVQPFNLACQLIEELSNIAPVYVIIGNHDYINNSQFLTTNHIFNPLKKWDNVFVVDEPVFHTYKDYSFVFCPYVEPGRFVEALDHLVSGGEMWDLADCIFAHQEFKGCKMGAFISDAGDDWDENYPAVISGHIHDAQTVGENIFYPGSAIQHAFGESPDKNMWEVVFGGLGEPPFFFIQKINLGMKGKKIIALNVSEIESFDAKILDKFHVKLTLSGTTEQFKLFRKTPKYSELQRKGIKFSYKPIQDSVHEIAGEARSRKQVSYHEILKEVVRKKTEAVKESYRNVIGGVVEGSEDDDGSDEEIIVQLVFDDSASFETDVSDVSDAESFETDEE